MEYVYKVDCDSCYYASGCEYKGMFVECDGYEPQESEEEQ